MRSLFGLFLFPEGGVVLKFFHYIPAGIKGLLAMTGPRGDQHDGLAGLDPSDTVDHQGVQQLVCFELATDNTVQLFFGHARIIIQVHGLNGLSFIEIPHAAHKCRTGADFGPAALL